MDIVKITQMVTYCGHLPNENLNTSKGSFVQVQLEGDKGYLRADKEFLKEYSLRGKEGKAWRLEWSGTLYKERTDYGRCIGVIYGWRWVEDEEVEKAKTGARFNRGKVKLQDIPPSFELMLGEVMTENPGLRIDLIPKRMIVELAKVFTKGCEKYTERNWEKGLSWMSTIGSALRHILKWRRGERLDNELKVHHLAQAIWNLTAILEFETTHPELDDRPKNTMDLESGE